MADPHSHGHDHAHDHGHAHTHSQPPGVDAELMPAVSDPAQAALVGALQASFRILGALMIVMVVLYIASGVFQVQTGEQGLIMRFGRLVQRGAPGQESRVFEQGVHFGLPEPLDERIKLPATTRTLEIDTFMFERSAEDYGKKVVEMSGVSPQVRPGKDGAMITGDQSLAHGLWNVEYRIERGDQFVQNVGTRVEQAEPIIQRLAESAILRAVSSRRLTEVAVGDAATVVPEVQARLQKELDELQTGVRIVNLTARTVEPTAVKTAVQDVNVAEQDKLNLEDKARADATQKLNAAAGREYTVLLERIREYGAAQAAKAPPERLAELRSGIDAVLETAGGQVAVRLREARADAAAIREGVQREYKEFSDMLEQYRKHPRLVEMQLWTGVRDTVLGSPDNEPFYVGDSDTLEIIVNRDPQLEREREIKRMQDATNPRPPGQ